MIKNPSRSIRFHRRVRRKQIRRRIPRPAHLRDSEPLPYLKRDGLLTRGELVFFRVLRRAVKGQYAISIKTRLADVIKCPDDLWDTPHGRRLCQKHLDFVLYDTWTSAIVAAVELDDRSHERPERKVRDRFVDEALRVGGVILVRIQAAARYDAEIIATELQTALTALPAS